MNSLKLFYDEVSSGVSTHKLAEYEVLLARERERIAHHRTTGYTTEYASINLPGDSAIMHAVEQMIEKKKHELDIKVVVVIGIGGSSLGALAVQEALHGALYNQVSAGGKKLFFVESTDSDYIHQVIECVKHECARGGDVLVNVVTKSGSTTETVVNFQIFLNFLRTYWPHDWKRRLVCTTDERSKLAVYAQQEQIDMLTIPAQVGGRYSVFSAVGLFPLGCVGVDITELVAGARGMVEACVNWSIEKNPAALSAALVYEHYRQGKIIHDTFIFSRDVRAVGEWYRQLVGEGLGKEHDLSGAVVHAGITPTISLGCNDLHSVAQLYLAGPKDKFTTFIYVKHDNTSITVPDDAQLASLVEHVQGKSVTDIMHAMFGGVERAYRSQACPFVTIELPQKSAFYLGQLLQLKMIEVMYLGSLMNINPFDQPHVELYKKATRELLSRAKI